MSNHLPVIVNGSFLAQPPTGVQRYAIEIYRHLKKSLPILTLVAPKNIHTPAIANELEAIIIGRFTGHLWEQLELYRYVKKRKALLLCLDMKSPLLYRKKIITIHDLNFLYNPAWVPKKFYYFYRFMVTAGARQSLAILTVSQFSKDEVIRFLKVPPAKVTVIYNATPAHFVKNPEDSTAEVQGQYILSVSSTDPRKNIDRLIKSFAQLKLPDVQLVLVGLPHRKDIDYTSVQGNILFLGHVDDQKLMNLYQHATAFVYPSMYEGFGIPPLEAMQYGCPVVAAKTSSLPEVCGDAALYVDPFSEQAIGEGIKKILFSYTLREKLIEAGYQRIQLFSWSKSVDVLKKVLEVY